MLAALGLLGAACTGGDDDTADTVDVSSAAADESTTSVADDGTTASSSADASTTSTIAEATTTTAELAGEDFDGFVADGDVLAVVGVAHDDELNVRAGPGTDQGILTFAPPEADDLVATGRGRLLPSSIWYEVAYGGQVGWVGSAFVGYKGGTVDDTANFLGGDGPASFETMQEMGEFVAAEYASVDPPSNIVQSVAPTVGGGLGEVTYDVVGIGDDAVMGFRVHVFANEDENGETFTLRTIELTTFCTRGLAGELCR